MPSPFINLDERGRHTPSPRPPSPLAYPVRKGLITRGLVDLVAPPLQTRGHRPVVVAANHIRIAGGGASAFRLRGIEAGLPLRPVVALELVGALLFLGLAVLRVDHQIILRTAIRGWRRLLVRRR